jgi:hypothetical protein
MLVLAELDERRDPAHQGEVDVRVRRQVFCP